MGREKIPSVNHESRRRFRYGMAIVGSLALIAAGASYYAAVHHSSPISSRSTETAAVSSNQTQGNGLYPTRKTTATMFWVGETASADNGYIPNKSSAWVENWQAAFGGIDNPKIRCRIYLPCFAYHENPFYFALPFDDLKDNGDPKPASELKRIYWDPDGQPAPDGQSLVKNRWIAVTNNGKTVYAQWEDVGPFNEDDVNYVFGDQPPQYPAGLDLSPAAALYINLNGEAHVSWHFVDASQVPDGPWKQIVTKSGVS